MLYFTNYIVVNINNQGYDVHKNKKLICNNTKMVKNKCCYFF